MRQVVVLCFLFACGGESPPPCAFHTSADDAEPPPLATPRWAFRPWISKDISDGADTRAFVAGFRERGIPVGAVVLDSPWETHYNTFVVNDQRYPAFRDMVAELHAENIKIVLWTTQMVNRTGFDLEPGGDSYTGPAANYEEGKRCGFYVDQGAEYLWWKGIGAGVDFFDPDARGWWHRQQDPLYDMGIDGWKLDFGDQYLTDSVETDDGVIDRQLYSEAYYKDFLAYGTSKRGPEFLTMVRPYDRSYGFPGRFYARPEHTPVGWVGDQRRDYVGLADALDHIFRSADAGYRVLGSDIGGYLDHDDENLGSPEIPFDTVVFARWTAVSALMPWMQLHGRANITPWTVPDHVDETVAMYRYWSLLHDDWVPFFYSLSKAGTILHPLAREGDYRYTIGNDVLVAPVLDATGMRQVVLPAGNWYDWWQPAAAPVSGTVSTTSPREQIPVFIREGAIIPTNSAILVWPAATQSTFALVDTDDQLTTIRASATRVELSRSLRATVFRVHRDTAPTTVTGATFTYDPATKTLTLMLASGTTAADFQ